jgi:hypothetical protein
VAKGTRNRLQSDATSECGSDAARGWATLQAFVVAAGLLASLVFIVAGLTWDLQLYGDGAIFAYGVAVQDSWAIHWHNIIARATVYLATCLPAETYVALTGNARGGITLYSLLFFSAQLVGLVATFMADACCSPSPVFRPPSYARSCSVSPQRCGSPTLCSGRR